MTSQFPDMKISLEASIRAPSAVPIDDAVLPFEVSSLDLRGRLTRLGPALDDVLAKHAYPPAVGALLGHGHLAMTIDQGPDMSRYQGLVALEGGSLEDAAHEYFLRSEQIPTRVRLAVGEEWRGGEGGGPKHRWRAGGML